MSEALLQVLAFAPHFHGTCYISLPNRKVGHRLIPLFDCSISTVNCMPSRYQCALRSAYGVDVLDWYGTIHFSANDVESPLLNEQALIPRCDVPPVR